MKKIGLAIILSVVFVLFAAAQNTTIINYGDTWKYLDNNTRPTDWQLPTFDDMTWASGAAELGYGDGDEATVVSFGGVGSNKYTTTYFRKTINIPSLNNLLYFTLNLVRDDGAVVYINGVEAARSNMPTGTIDHTTFAASNVDGAPESTPVAYTIPVSSFVAGNNTIAVEIHQRNLSSSDISFRMELISTGVEELIPYSSAWKYLDNNTRPANWETTTFVDGGWVSGNAELGYNDGDEATVISFGGVASNKHITTYFRKTINITDINAYTNYTLNLVRDDGAVVYLNGVEVARSNMPTGVIGHSTLASTGVTGAAESTPISYNLSHCNFVNGNNVIAVEVHQDAPTSSDISFRLELLAVPVTEALALSRGPYLQAGTETEITIRWRTNNPTVGRLRVGTANGTYTTATVQETCSGAEHIVKVTGLQPDTKYFYEVGTATGTVLQSGVANFFTTNPPTSTSRKIRVTAFGDCGRSSATFQDNNLTNYLNFLNTNNIDAPDAWILLGDNAYNAGTDAEYSSNFFGIYEDNILKNHKLYPSPGNHDYANSTGNKVLRTLPYHTNFTVPKSGEAGGVASNKSNYYSYNVGNIHFLSLDSYGIEEDGTNMQSAGVTAMKTWIEADLAANTNKWIVAYWHHPPYTKASHDSDLENELINIRQNFITYLESKGVDLIINGHSHAYERGYLTRNYTTNWASFTPAMHSVSTSSAVYNNASTCPYVYNTTPVNHGTVYVVAGSTGANGGIETGFASGPMPFAVQDAGIFYFEVEGNRLDAQMLRRNGTVFDKFTIMKDVNVTNNISVNNGSTATLTASWPQAGNYTWTGTTGTTKSVTVTPPADATTNYTVTDAFGCITDIFAVTAVNNLPVSLLSYSAALQGNKVQVSWTTVTERDNKHFVIERSSNGQDYTAIATVNGNGTTSNTSNYQFTDYQPLLGVSYYRLKQVDLNNTTKILGVKKIVYQKEAFIIKGQLNNIGSIQFGLQMFRSETVDIHAFDVNGRLVKKEQKQLTAGNYNFSYPAAAGTYIVEVTSKSGFSVKEKIIVQ